MYAETVSVPGIDDGLLSLAFPAISNLQKVNDLYCFPGLGTPSDLAFSWGGQQWTIIAADLNIGRANLTLPYPAPLSTLHA
ncbi:hypothetical protein VTO73DRAFT_6615 [Trametes versicolor]